VHRVARGECCLDNVLFLIALSEVPAGDHGIASVLVDLSAQLDDRSVHIEEYCREKLMELLVPKPNRKGREPFTWSKMNSRSSCLGR